MDPEEFARILEAISLEDGGGALWALEEFNSAADRRVLDQSQADQLQSKLDWFLRNVCAKGAFEEAWALLNNLGHPQSINVCLEMLGEEWHDFAIFGVHPVRMMNPLGLAAYTVGSIFETLDGSGKRSAFAPLRKRCLPVLETAIKRFESDLFLYAINGALCAMCCMVRCNELFGKGVLPDAEFLKELAVMETHAQRYLNYRPDGVEDLSEDEEADYATPASVRESASGLLTCIRVVRGEEKL